MHRFSVLGLCFLCLQCVLLCCNCACKLVNVFLNLFVFCLCACLILIIMNSLKWCHCGGKRSKIRQDLLWLVHVQWCHCVSLYVIHMFSPTFNWWAGVWFHECNLFTVNFFTTFKFHKRVCYPPSFNIKYGSDLHILVVIDSRDWESQVNYSKILAQRKQVCQFCKKCYFIVHTFHCVFFLLLSVTETWHGTHCSCRKDTHKKSFSTGELSQ